MESLPSSRRDPISSRTAAAVALVVGAAFVLRLAWRLHLGAPDFFEKGYRFYYDVASELAAGRGFHWHDRSDIEGPVYASFLALASLLGKSYLWIVVPEALMGAGTAFCAFLIGRELFGTAAGGIACLGTAIYPYYVAHDTALQETGMFTLATALSVYLLLGARRSSAVRLWVIAGLCLGAATLTRLTLAPFVAAAIPWIAVVGEGSRRLRLRRAAVVGLSCALVIGSWLVRNTEAVGAPVLTTGFGYSLWIANNPKTFSHFPRESIDQSDIASQTGLTPADKEQIAPFSRDPLQTSAWFRRKAIAYVRANPGASLRGAIRKIGVAFSWRFCPAAPRSKQWVYLCSYGPVSLLAILGLVMARSQWRKWSLIGLLALSFIAVTAVFWAQTSHRVFLDVYLIVLAAGPLSLALVRRRTAPRTERDPYPGEAGPPARFIRPASSFASRWLGRSIQR